MNIDIRQLHYFKEIVDQGSISKAAQILHIAQPPLSQQKEILKNFLKNWIVKKSKSHYYYGLVTVKNMWSKHSRNKNTLWLVRAVGKTCFHRKE